jgi:cell division septal protein FtsQ
MISVLRNHRAKKRRQVLRKFLLWLLFPIFGAGGIALILLLSPYFHIRHISVTGNSAVPKEDIIRYTERVLSGAVFGLFPERNMFVFPSVRMEERILRAFPLVASADILLAWRSKEITITVSERASWGLYCRHVSEPCFYIATDGVLLGTAPRLSGSSIVRIIDIRENQPERIAGAVGIEHQKALRIQHIAGRLKSAYQLESKEIILGRGFNERTELYTAEGWYILYDEKTNIARALENLDLVLSQQIEDRAKLEYIDVRFAGKVFYKEK